MSDWHNDINRYTLTDRACEEDTPYLVIHEMIDHGYAEPWEIIHILKKKIENNVYEKLMIYDKLGLKF